MIKLITHFKRWNKWRKYSLNNKLYKFLVLIGLIKSPTMMFTLTDEENAFYLEAIDCGVELEER